MRSRVILVIGVVILLMAFMMSMVACKGVSDKLDKYPKPDNMERTVQKFVDWFKDSTRLDFEKFAEEKTISVYVLYGVPEDQLETDEIPSKYYGLLYYTRSQEIDLRSWIQWKIPWMGNIYEYPVTSAFRFAWRPAAFNYYETGIVSPGSLRLDGLRFYTKLQINLDRIEKKSECKKPRGEVISIKLPNKNTLKYRVTYHLLGQ